MQKKPVIAMQHGNTLSWIRMYSAGKNKNNYYSMEKIELPWDQAEEF
jgi:hypothetical protein